MRIGFGMRQALKRKNVPLGMLRAIEDQLNASFSQVSVQCSGSLTFWHAEFRYVSNSVPKP
jgi:hypothetical protein